jgi:hypothetical protein
MVSLSNRLLGILTGFANAKYPLIKDYCFLAQMIVV